MTFKDQYQSPRDDSAIITIPSGQQSSSIIDTAGMSLVGVRIPASFTGTSISIQESNSLTGTFRDVYNVNGVAASFPVAANRTVMFNPSDLAGLQFICLKSNAAEALDRSLNLILRTV